MKLFTEASRVVLVASVPAVLMSIFPYKAIGFRAEKRAETRRTGMCRFVKLTAEEETDALNAARAAWATDASNLRRIRLELMGEELPDYGGGELLGYESPTERRERVRFVPEMLPESLGAGEPAAIKAEEKQPEPALAFPREEMLKLQ